MARRAEPDYVSGEKGRYSIAPPIVHPPHCVCSTCPKRRKTLEDWERPLVIRIFRKADNPDNRFAASQQAFRVKREEEARLRLAVEEAAARKQARAGAVMFGTLCDAYRQHLRDEGKRLDRAEPRIANIEALIGRHRDATAIGWDEYQELRAEVSRLAAQTRRHYESTLQAILNFGVTHRIIPHSSLGKVPLTTVRTADTPVFWTKREIAVILGPAMDAFEREQGERLSRPVTQKGRRKERRNDSRMPLRGLCLVAYFMLPRPISNFGLTWDELDERCTRFRLRRHKNARRAIKAEGPIAEPLSRYLRAIRPENATGLIHPNPDTGKPYTDIRKQWIRLIDHASAILEYPLKGRKADFFTFRHTGASHLAERTKNPVLVVKMMGDTNIQTVMRHYFNLDLEFMAEMVEGWTVPALDRPAADDQVN